MAKPHRIGGPSDLEYERLYRFYERLEQRERLRRIPQLTTIALLVSAPVMLSMFSWVCSHNEHHAASSQIAASRSVIAE
jgi:hypothetical protein